MKLRCIYDFRILSWFQIQAITLYPFIFFASSEEKISKGLFSHELQHVLQIQQLGWFRFYFSYLKFYFHFRRRGLNHRDAYLQIPFEIEARMAEREKLSSEEMAKLETLFTNKQQS